uniref:Uncharacterized protein n=1 Tax=Siphoviridae sp. ctxzZ3 TaxID=2826523 RepID=A0A8S5NDQ1_9CAUD|nr:MAG TPA: hypothetical protein [Siphoviridae sp. ctxzZ3]
MVAIDRLIKERICHRKYKSSVSVAKDIYETGFY